MAPEMKIVWSFNNIEQIEDLPEYVLRVKKNTIKEFYHIFYGQILGHERREYDS